MTGKLKDVDGKTLYTLFPTYSWLSYQECVHLLLNYATGKLATTATSSSMRPTLIAASLATTRCTTWRSRTCWTPWARVTAVRPVFLRFPLIHWLTFWAATHRGLQLAHRAVLVLQNDKGAKYPGPGPLI